MVMSLDEEMRGEISRLENEIAALDMQIEALNAKVMQMLSSRNKKLHDMRILKANFGLSDEKAAQTTLAKILR